MKKLFGVAAAVAMALTGCGPSICEELEEASKTFGEKYRPCGEGETTTFPVSDTCSKDIEQCTDKEKEVVSDFAECINKMHRCDPDNPDQFSNEVFTCVIDLYNGASEKCLVATGIFGGA
jgi:hypothetical protein